MLSLTHSSFGPMVLLDSGAAISVVMSCLTPYFTSSLTCAAATADGNSLSVSGQGELGPLSNVLISNTIRHNCISVSQLSDIGITVSFTPTGVSVANGVTSVYGRRESGLYKLSLHDLLSLSSVSVCNIGSQRPNVDDLDLWHRRLADTSHRAIREAVRNKLIEGVTLDRKFFNVKSRKSYRCACDICARAKMHQISFPLCAIGWRDYPLVRVCMLMSLSCRTSLLVRVTSMYSLLLIMPRRCVECILSRQESRSINILAHPTTFVNEVLPSLNIRLRHFYSDGGAELVAAEVLTFLHKSGVTTSHSPGDTPQMNSITERWVCSLKEKVLCMLLRSSLPVAFWWLAVECAVYLLNRLPPKTVLGYMSPYECVCGAAPDLKWIHIWGCKCYALKPKADRRKDFDEKAYTGFLVGYAQQNTGYLVFVPALDKIVVSVHVMFNETIPDPTAEYFSELERLKIEVASESRDPKDY